jgi:acetyl esterase
VSLYGRLAGRLYLERGEPVMVVKSWAGKGPRNVLIERADGSQVVRPFRGLRQLPETWRTIPHAPGYQASDRGRIRNARTGRVLKPTKMPRGYWKVNLGHKCRDQYVHRLVLIAFAGSMGSGWEVDHYDFDRNNNRLSNLRWMRKSDNAWRWEVYAQERPEPPPYTREGLLLALSEHPMPELAGVTMREAA